MVSVICCGSSRVAPEFQNMSDPSKFFNDTGVVEVKPIKTLRMLLKNYETEQLMGLLAFGGDRDFLIFWNWYYTTINESKTQLQIASLGDRQIISAFLAASTIASRSKGVAQNFMKELTTQRQWNQLHQIHNIHLIAEVLSEVLRRAGKLVQNDSGFKAIDDDRREEVFIKFQDFLKRNNFTLNKKEESKLVEPKISV